MGRREMTSLTSEKYIKKDHVKSEYIIFRFIDEQADNPGFGSCPEATHVLCPIEVHLLCMRQRRSAGFDLHTSLTCDRKLRARLSHCHG